MDCINILAKFFNIDNKLWGTFVSKSGQILSLKAKVLVDVSLTFVELISAAFQSGFSAKLMSSRSSKKLSGHVFTKGRILSPAPVTQDFINLSFSLTCR